MLSIATNVLIVLTDQYRADCLGVAGNPDVRTPTLDALAADGIHFPDSYCTAPLCTPSRYSLLTGLYPHQHGVHGNNETLASDLWTLPERARTAGIGTTAVGKMHLAPTYLDVGFDRLILSEQDGSGRLSDDYHRDLLAANVVDGNDLVDQRREYRDRAGEKYWTSYGAGPSDLPDSLHSTTWIADRAVEQIDERWRAGGQLMYLSFIKPHHPFDPPHPWDQMYDPRALSVLPGWTDTVSELDRSRGYFDYDALDTESLRHVMAMYYASISHVDFHLGRVLDRLRELDAYDRTLIIFTADHGEYLGFHHMLLKGGPMYDPLIRVPLLMKRPGQHGAGTTDNRMASGIDVVPTALAALGLSTEDLPGHDLNDPTWDREAVVTESRAEGYAIRTRFDKLLVRSDESLYFDLEADPLELKPLDPDLTADRPLSLKSELEQTLDLRPMRRVGAPAMRSELPPERSDPDDTPESRAARFEKLMDASHPWL